MKKIQLCLLLCLVFLPAKEFAQVKPDGQKAWKHVSHLASDNFKGRKSGTPEYQKAAEYAAQKMKEYGLQPGGNDNTYFQNVELKNWKHFSSPTRLEIISPERRIYVPGRKRDFFPNSGTGSGVVKGQLAFAGYGLVSDEEGWDDYASLDIPGKIVLIIPSAPDFMQKLSTQEKSIDQKVKTAVGKGAAGVLFMNIGEGIKGGKNPHGPKKDTCPEDFLVLSANEHVLDEIFNMGNSSWRTLLSQTLREKKSFSSSLDVTIEMETHFIQEDRNAPNVLGILPGNHPQLKEEYIILGGHLDHLGIGIDGKIFNGADDNTTGVAVMLEVARVLNLNQFKPDRSIVFAAWAAEEMGLLGSKFYTNDPIYPLEKTAVYMNIDMVGCGDDDLYAGGMWEFSQFYDLLKKNMPEELNERLRYRLNYRGSDHSAFLKKGVTAVSLRTGNTRTTKMDDEHPEYHKPGDRPNIIQPELLQLAADYHVENLIFLANCKENLLDPKFHVEFIHKESDVIDMHCDTIDRFLKGEDLSQDNPKGHIDIPKLKQGSVDLQVFACYTRPPSNELEKNQAARKIFDMVDAVHQLVEENPQDLMLVESEKDFAKIKGSQKAGIVIGIEGGYAIESNLRLLRSFYRSGVRLMTLTHWSDTEWADASGDPEVNFGGLTEFGEDVVKEMNRLGMIIDVSHVHDETFWDIIHLTDAPVVASHSCCRIFNDYHRNLSDDMLTALAENGGVIGINFLPSFLNEELRLLEDALMSEVARKLGLPDDWQSLMQAGPDAIKRFREEYQRKKSEIKHKWPKVDVKTVVDHIEHVIKVTGNSDHVGLGSDFDGISETPEGLEHMGRVANITAELVRRGHKDEDIKKILGGNFLRVFKKVCGDKKTETQAATIQD
jgi:membrane dipeptidase